MNEKTKKVHAAIKGVIAQQLRGLSDDDIIQVCEELNADLDGYVMVATDRRKQHDLANEQMADMQVSGAVPRTDEPEE